MRHFTRPATVFSSLPGLPARVPGMAFLLLLWALSVPLGGISPAAGEEPLSAPQCPKYREICVKGQGQGRLDMKTGEAVMSGGVSGSLLKQNLVFRGESLRAARGEEGEWERITIEGPLRITQPGRELSAEHGLIDDTGYKVEGSVRLEQEGMQLTSTSMRYSLETGKLLIEGLPEAPVEMVVEKQAEFLNAEESALPESSGDGSGEEEQDGLPAMEEPAGPAITRMTAERAELDKTGRTIAMWGNLKVEQQPDSLFMSAGNAELVFDGQKELESFRAGGSVVITQPGRVLSADTALSRDGLKTIILNGNARVRQPGSFDITGESLEVSGEVGKGAVKLSAPQKEPRERPTEAPGVGGNPAGATEQAGGREQEPKPQERDLKFTLELSGGRQSYQLTPLALNRLRKEGLPDASAARLSILVGQTHDSRESFVQQLELVLGKEDSAQYQEQILAAARRRDTGEAPRDKDAGGGGKP